MQVPYHFLLNVWMNEWVNRNTICTLIYVILRIIVWLVPMVSRHFKPITYLNPDIGHVNYCLFLFGFFVLLLFLPTLAVGAFHSFRQDKLPPTFLGQDAQQHNSTIVQKQQALQRANFDVKSLFHVLHSRGKQTNRTKFLTKDLLHNLLRSPHTDCTRSEDFLVRVASSFISL